MGDKDAFSLFSSLRYDVSIREVPRQDMAFAGWNYKNESPFYMLDYHRDRILRAANHWQWEPAIAVLTGQKGLDTLSQSAVKFLSTSSPDHLRLRILVDRNGSITFEKSPTPPRALENLFPVRLPPPDEPLAPGDPRLSPPFTVVLDKDITSRSEFTHFKTTKRAMYDAARQRARITPTDDKEVLIINEEDQSIMEGSTTTPYFWRNGRWVTPPVPSRFSWTDGSGGQDGTSRRWALERGIALEEKVLAESVRQDEACWLSNGVKGFVFARIQILGDPSPTV